MIPLVKNYISRLFIKVVELYDLIAVFSILGAVLAIIILTILRVFPQKTTKKALDKTIIAQNDVIVQQSDFIKERYEKTINSLAKRNRDLEKELNPVDEDGEPVKEDVPWEVIQAGAQQMGISPMLLLPFKKKILQVTKGMSIEEIQQLAAAGKGSIGGILTGQKPQVDDSAQFGTFPEEKLR